MRKDLAMNNKQVKRVSFIQIITTSLTLLLLAACTGNNIVHLDSPVVQLNNLDDYDKDGVIEAREKCDETTLGASIDNYGCGTQIPRTEPFKINIKFENNSFVIPELAYEKVNELADFLENNQGVKVVIEGHTDNAPISTAAVKDNWDLSVKRSTAIVRELQTKYAVTPSRLIAAGRSSYIPLVANDTPENKSKNRRTKIIIMPRLNQFFNLLDQKVE